MADNKQLPYCPLAAISLARRIRPSARRRCRSLDRPPLRLASLRRSSSRFAAAALALPTASARSCLCRSMLLVPHSLKAALPPSLPAPQLFLVLQLLLPLLLPLNSLTSSPVPVPLSSSASGTYGGMLVGVYVGIVSGSL